MKRLRRLWQETLERIEEFLGERGEVPAQVWPEVEQQQQEVLQPWLEEVAAAGIRGAGLTNWNLVNREAAAWAEQHSRVLAGRLRQTLEQRVQALVSEWILAGEDFPALVKRVRQVIDDPKRAALVSATEATRAYAEGNTLAWRAAGVEMREWRTAQDDLVCSICGPLAGQRAAMGQPFGGKIANPPAHPGCRCSLAPVVAPDELPVTPEHYRQRAGWQETIADLAKDEDFTVVGNVRITGERKRHWRARHAAQNLTPQIENEILPQALVSPALMMPDPKNPANMRYYAQDKAGKWWRVIVATGKSKERFVLTLHRVQKAGK